MTFGYGTGAFEVTADRLGCYRPEEHIGMCLLDISFELFTSWFSPFLSTLCILNSSILSSVFCPCHFIISKTNM